MNDLDSIRVDDTFFHWDGVDPAELRRVQDQMFPYSSTALAIVALRGQMQITQKQLADLVGTTQSAISRAESGKHAVSSALLRRIAIGTGTKVVMAFEARR